MPIRPTSYRATPAAAAVLGDVVAGERTAFLNRAIVLLGGLRDNLDPLHLRALEVEAESKGMEFAAYLAELLKPSALALVRRSADS